jgi:hypothetical protein
MNHGFGQIQPDDFYVRATPCQVNQELTGTGPKVEKCGIPVETLAAFKCIEMVERQQGTSVCSLGMERFYAADLVHHSRRLRRSFQDGRAHGFTKK